MKEKLIQEISTAMAEVLSFEQVAHLNSVLLQVVSQYTITEDGETLHENAASNDRLLDIFLSAKQVEGCTTPTIKYYGSTIRQLFKKMPKKVTDYTTLLYFSEKTNQAKLPLIIFVGYFLRSLLGLKRRTTSSKALSAEYIR